MRPRCGRRLAAVVTVVLGIAVLVMATPASGAPRLQPAAPQPPGSTMTPPTTLLAGGGTAAPNVSIAGGAPATSTTLGLVPAQPTADPGLFDIPGRIREAIDDWFQNLVAGAVGPAMDLLGRTLLATPTAVTGPRARELWQVSLGLADGAYVLLVTIAGVILLAHESLQVQYTVKEMAPRLLVGLAAANLSLWLAGQAVELANAASAALLGQGVDPRQVAATIKTLALAPLQPGSVFVPLLVGVLVVLALLLAGTCVVRAMLVVFLVVAAPIMLAAHALPQTEGLARLWWRAMTACLGVQLAQALALAMAVRVFFEADRQSVLPLGGGGHLVDVLVACCLLWLLVRIPSWAARMVLEGGRRSTLARLVKGMTVVRTTRGVRDAVGAIR